MTEMKPSEPGSEYISQCPACLCMTKTIGVFCGKCESVKVVKQPGSEGTGEVMDLKKRAEELFYYLETTKETGRVTWEYVIRVEQALRQVREETIEQCASIVDRSVKIHVKPNQSGESWLECLKTPPELSTEIRELKVFTRRTNVVNVSWNRLSISPAPCGRGGGVSMKFPKHDASLHLQHNDHKSSYETVGEYLEQGHLTDFYEFKNDEQKKRAIETNELWTLQWYPNTPVGFNAVAAPTLEELLDFANEEEK